MTDLISRSALLTTLRKERDDYLREHFVQDPDTGTHEASNAKEEYLSELDDRIAFVEAFPAVEPIAKLVNNNQVGCLNIIETAPNVTIDIGTPLFAAPLSPGPLSKGEDFRTWWERGLAVPKPDLRGPFFSTQWEREDYERSKRGEAELGPSLPNGGRHD